MTARALAVRLWPAGWVARAVVAAVPLLLVAFLVWWLLIRPRAAQVKAVTAHVEASMAKGAAGAAQDTVHIVVENQRTIERIDRTTEGNDRAIHAAAGADASAGAVAGALRSALCLRDAYRDHPECAAVPGDGGGVGPAQADPGRGPASE